VVTLRIADEWRVIVPLVPQVLASHYFLFFHADFGYRTEYCTRMEAFIHCTKLNKETPKISATMPIPEYIYIPTTICFETEYRNDDNGLSSSVGLAFSDKDLCPVDSERNVSRSPVVASVSKSSHSSPRLPLRKKSFSAKGSPPRLPCRCKTKKKLPVQGQAAPKMPSRHLSRETLTSVWNDVIQMEQQSCFSNYLAKAA
jgi:hypothetical protein